MTFDGGKLAGWRLVPPPMPLLDFSQLNRRVIGPVHGDQGYFMGFLNERNVELSVERFQLVEVAQMKEDVFECD